MYKAQADFFHYHSPDGSTARPDGRHAGLDRTVSSRELLGHLLSSPPRWPNKPGKNVRPYVRPYVHSQTQCSHKSNSGIC